MSCLQADLLIALGVRFDDRVTGKLEAFAQHAKIVHIDIDAAEIGKNKYVNVPVSTGLGSMTCFHARHLGLCSVSWACFVLHMPLVYCVGDHGG